MRMVQVTQDFEKNGKKFQKGHAYVMAEDAEAQYRAIVGSYLGMSYPIETIYREYKGEDLNNKKLFAFRTGGVGDIFFLNPVLVYLKKKYPTCTIRVASGCKQPLENLPEIDELYDMPFDAELLKSSDYQKMFQGIIETSNETSKRVHAVDMFFSYFKIDSIQLPKEVKKPKLIYTDDELKWLDKTCKDLNIKKDDFVIGIQMETSAPLRNFPKEKMKIIIDVLAKEPNVKIVLIGTQAQANVGTYYKSNYENVTLAINYTVRQALILAKRYNLVISPDTFMVQAAGALETPLIGLYGPFASEVRMKYFKNAIGLDPKVACSPCFKHDFRACIKGNPSPCFSLIKPEDILQATDFLRYRIYKKHFNFINHFIKTPDLSQVEQYMLGADKGLGFFCGYYKHHNMIRVDTNHFAKPDITDLSTEFKRNSYPFVLYMNDFSPNRLSVYQGSKSMVRPGGYFIVYKEASAEQFFQEIKQDIGKDFTLLYANYDPTQKICLVAGKKPY